jgi:hypothetical protein
VRVPRRGTKECAQCGGPGSTFITKPSPVGAAPAGSPVRDSGEIELEWTGRQSERMGTPLRVKITELPPPEQNRLGWGTLEIVDWGHPSTLEIVDWATRRVRSLSEQKSVMREGFAGA